MDINRYSPSYAVNNKHLTKLSDLSAEEVFEYLYATKVLKGKYLAHEDTCIIKGITIAALFADTSIRMRSALAIGVRQLGGIFLDLPYNASDMAASENIKDIVNVIERYGVKALVTRSISEKELDDYCKVSPLPIINTSNDNCSPVQALCDLYTIWDRKGKLEGLKIAYVGKATNNATSLITAAVKCGMDVTISTPESFAFSDENLNRAMQYGNIRIAYDPVEAVKNVDIVYTDSYNYHIAVPKEEREILKPYQVTNTLMSYAAHKALFMHPLPASRGVEVTEEIIDGKCSVVLEQGENKLHTVKAIMALLVK